MLAHERRVDDTADTSSSDNDGNGDKGRSPAHTLNKENSDGGEIMDRNEDTDLDGRDSRHLLDVFQAEVCLVF